MRACASPKGQPTPVHDFRSRARRESYQPPERRSVHCDHRPEHPEVPGAFAGGQRTRQRSWRKRERGAVQLDSRADGLPRTSTLSGRITSFPTKTACSELTCVTRPLLRFPRPSTQRCPGRMPTGRSGSWKKPTYSVPFSANTVRVAMDRTYGLTNHYDDSSAINPAANDPSLAMNPASSARAPQVSLSGTGITLAPGGLHSGPCKISGIRFSRCTTTLS